MWYAEFDQMSNIHSIVSEKHCDDECMFWQGSSSTEYDDQLYICGDHLTNPNANPETGEYTGAVASLTPSGKARWYIRISGDNIGGRNQDKCLGIGMSKTGTYKIGVLIQGKMSELRVQNSNVYDTIILLVSSDGLA